MFYHDSYLFDYSGFSRESKLLVSAVESQDIAILYQRARDTIDLVSSKVDRLPSWLGTMEMPLKLTEAQSSDYHNSVIGQLFMIVMSKYVERCPRLIGDKWRSLRDALMKLDWKDDVLNNLFLGLPIGLLVIDEYPLQHLSIVEHKDHYWRWIRPLYSYNQGGWLPKEQCEYLYEAMKSMHRRIASIKYSGSLSLTSEQRRMWEHQVQVGYEDALAMLSSAIVANKGLFMAILWEDTDAVAEQD